MPDAHDSRFFRLRPGGVSCDEDGLFVGSVALLSIRKGASGVAGWAVRPESELNAELSACYGLPVDIATKVSRLACVARALNNRDLVSAAIGALHLHEMAKYKNPVEIALMWQVKRMLDPKGIMNPGRVLPPVH